MNLSHLESLKQELLKSITLQKDQEILNLLTELGKWKANPSDLKSTKLGITVNEIRKNEQMSSRIKESAKDLVLKWKRDVEQGKSNSANAHSHESLAPTESSHTPPEEPIKTEGVKNPLKRQISQVSSISTIEIQSQANRSASTDDISTSLTRDKMRNKCIEMLYNAIAPGCMAESDYILSKASLIEESVFKDNGSSSEDSKYKAKIRSLVSNLKDKKNPELKSRVLGGKITPDRLSTMTPEEMMSKDKKQKVQKAIAAEMNEIQSAGNNQSETDMFKCGKCQKRKTSYYQMQTRSADEPMTTFVTCLNCDHRWKFC